MRRTAFSLLELLIAVAVVGILIALLLPAVQYSREAARRMQCSTNLRQIGVAIHTYESQHRSFPPGNGSTYSYLVAILPQMEMEPLYQTFDFARPTHGLAPNFKSYILTVSFPHYRCPSDDVASRKPYATNYAGNAGYDVVSLGYIGVFDGQDVANSPPNASGMAFRPSDVTDGLSRTALVGERLVGDGPPGSRLRANWATALSFGPGQHEQFCDACLAHQFHSWSSGAVFGNFWRGLWYDGLEGETLYTHCLPPNKESCSNGANIDTGVYTLGSNHSGGVQVVFADAHIEWVNSSIDRAVWRSLGTRAGNEVIGAIE